MMKSYFVIVVVQVKIKIKKTKTKTKKLKQKGKWGKHEGKIHQGWETIEHKYGKVQGGGGESATGVDRRRSCRSFEGEVQRMEC